MAVVGEFQSHVNAYEGFETFRIEGAELTQMGDGEQQIRSNSVLKLKDKISENANALPSLYYLHQDNWFIVHA